MTRRPRPLRTGETAIFAFLRHGEPMPEGATLASDLRGTSHGQHAVLIELPREERPS